MLRLLLYLAALSQLTGANTSPTPAEIDISSCPIPYFGQLYNKLYVDSSGDKLAVCFKGPYNPETKNNCLLATYNKVTKVSWEIQQSPIDSPSEYHESLTKLSGSSACRVVLNLQDVNSDVHVHYYLRPFDTQAAVKVLLTTFFTSSLLAVDVQVNGVTLHQWSFVQKEVDYYEDMSGCRNTGVFFKSDTVGCDSKGSSIVTCSESSVLKLSLCGPGKRCYHGQCKLQALCTVAGPTVIDISGRTVSVPNRCAYTLMSVTGFSVLAVFQERRRRDVNFLDHVILLLDRNGENVKIQLGPGETAQLDNKVLTLDTKVHGVKLSKFQNRIIALVELSGKITSVVFDGTTAQISISGSGAAPLVGLCVDSSKLSEVKDSQESSPSCETPYTDIADSRINCVTMTKHCELLNEAPFTSCHKFFDPKPYVIACTNILCKYPAVDSLQCQLLEAYATACSQYKEVQIEGWKSKAGCSAPRLSCQDTVCSSHEFCGEDISGRPRCLCRANFAFNYKSKDIVGDPTVCKMNSASVSLPGCLLVEKGIDYSSLHLNDQTCKGQMDEKTHMVTFGFNNNNKDCGAIVMAEGQKIIYKNTITTDTSSSSGVISRQSSVQMDFSCFYTQPGLKNFNFKTKGGTARQEISSGSWDPSLSMKMTYDLAGNQRIDFSVGVPLGQFIYFHVEAAALEGSFISLVADSCFANGNGLKYDLIINGCGNPEDRTIKVVSNIKGTGFILAFEMFQLKGSDTFSLGCNMKLCLMNDFTCIPKCQRRNKRRRRSVRPEYKDENLAFINASQST